MADTDDDYQSTDYQPTQHVTASMTPETADLFEAGRTIERLTRERDEARGMVTTAHRELGWSPPYWEAADG